MLKFTMPTLGMDFNLATESARDPADMIADSARNTSSFVTWAIDIVGATVDKLHVINNAAIDFRACDILLSPRYALLTKKEPNWFQDNHGFVKDNSVL